MDHTVYAGIRGKAPPTPHVGFRGTSWPGKIDAMFIQNVGEPLARQSSVVSQKMRILNW
jgi:hypothetical protein